ncbi:hypothetical protein CEXT_729441 [Caerostris extrusa]|uniref:Uncharacterized protein n=1 Tax=Caerostris extrusa TaxID=172846 RepID=A0AAV4RYL1_CAEEX|nr:hypothetical protein CEXT_729441 [Caerostris extrusa]
MMKKNLKEFTDAPAEAIRPLPSRKVRCLQTVHLRENYDYWVEVHKREEHQEDAKESEKEHMEEEEEKGRQRWRP